MTIKKGSKGLKAKPVSRGNQSSLEHENNLKPKGEVAIVVLGCRPYLKNGAINPELKSRVGKGLELYQRDFGSRILFSGGTHFSDIPEALVMKSLAESIPKSDILLEIHSKSTRENARFSKRTLLKHGIFEIIIVTSPYHISRAQKIFESMYGPQFTLHFVGSDFQPTFFIRISLLIQEWVKWILKM